MSIIVHRDFCRRKSIVVTLSCNFSRWKPVGGEFLENTQMEPDIMVRNEAGIMMTGRDQQLEEAVKVLLKK